MQLLAAEADMGGAEGVRAYDDELHLRRAPLESIIAHTAIYHFSSHLRDPLEQVDDLPKRPSRSEIQHVCSALRLETH
jgi:hypothetical protein